MAAKIKIKKNVDHHTMPTKCQSISTFHRPIHSHWTIPLTQAYRLQRLGLRRRNSFVFAYLHSKKILEKIFYLTQNFVKAKKYIFSVSSTHPTMCDLFIMYSSYITAHVLYLLSTPSQYTVYCRIVLGLEHRSVDKIQQTTRQRGKTCN
jgi:hypothetical protein